MHINTKSHYLINKYQSNRTNSFSIHKNQKAKSKNKFFQLQYLFNEPRIYNFSCGSKRKRGENYSFNSYKTEELSSIQQSPNVQNQSLNQIITKNVYKTVETFRQIHSKQRSNVQNKGIIHSRRQNRKIRSNQSLRDNKVSIQIARRQIKQRIKDSIIKGKTPIKIYPQPTIMEVNPISYKVQHAPKSSRLNHAINIRKISKISNNQISKIQYRKVQGKAYRPWSPVNEDPYQIDQILTIQ